jgi:ribosome maturation factor RimP
VGAATQPVKSMSGVKSVNPAPRYAFLPPGWRQFGARVPAGKVNPRTPDMPTWPITSIKELLEPTINHMGYELYSIDQSGQSGRTLRISIDHNDPITIEDCERVSRVAGPLLDHANLINGRYDLEVSSPGAERPLRSRIEYARFNGKRVNIRYRSGEADGVVEGQLIAVDDAGIAVQAPGVRGRAPVITHIGWEDVVAGRLAVAI